jgi:hypothetical protein
MVEMINELVMKIHFVSINKVNWVSWVIMVEVKMEIKNDFVMRLNKIVNYKNYLSKNLLEDLKTLMKNYFY